MFARFLQYIVYIYIYLLYLVLYLPTVMRIDWTRTNGIRQQVVYISEQSGFLGRRTKSSGCYLLADTYLKTSIITKWDPT